jgi:MFS family permease
LSARLLYILRWFLELHRPPTYGSEAEIAAEVERNYRWNFTANLLDVTLFWFGFSFISSTTVVPLYISKLSDSPLPLGIAAVIAQASWFLPQLLTANIVERLPRKKPVVVRVGFLLERLPIWLTVVSALVAVRSPGLALILFLLGYAWRGLGAGFVATSWQDLIARAFPTERRGRFMGISLFSGTVVGTVAALLSGRILDTFPFSTNFVYNFLFAASFVTLSWFFISQTREPASPGRPPRRSNRQFVNELPGIMRQDANFRRFLLARVLIAFGALGTGFVTVSAVHRWGIPNSTVGTYTAAQLIGQAVATPGFGLLADRFGHKLTLEMGALAAALAFTLAWLAPSQEWYFLVFALLGAMNGAIIVSGILIVMEFGPQDKRPTYAGLANTAVGVASVAAPLIGAALATTSYYLVFALSAGITLVGLLLLHFRVREPRHVTRPLKIEA